LRNKNKGRKTDMTTTITLDGGKQITIPGARVLNSKNSINKNGKPQRIVKFGDGVCTTTYHKDGSYTETIKKPNGEESITFNRNGQVLRKTNINYEC